VWADKESILSLDGGTFTLINWTVKLVLKNLALAVIYGLITAIHAKRIALTFSVYFENRNTLCRAIVLPGNTEPLLGVIPLEDMDVVLNPRHQTIMVNPEHPDMPVKPLK